MIDFKELAPMIVEAGKSIVPREAKQAGDSCIPLKKEQSIRSPLSSVFGCFRDWCPENWGAFRIPSSTERPSPCH